MLAFVVIACGLNVSALTTPTKDTPGCKEFVESLEYATETVGDSYSADVNDPERYEVPMSMMGCVSNSRVMVVKFEENHAGWQVRKWVCKNVRPSQDI